MIKDFDDLFYDRPACMNDIENITEAFNSYWEPLLGMPKFTCDDFHYGLNAPGFDIGASTRVVVNKGDGRIVGGILVLDYVHPPVHPFVQGCVHPDFEGRGIGEHLLIWAEHRAKQALNKLPAEIRVSMNLATLNTHQPTRRLFEKRGFKPVRHSYVMVAKLDNTLAEPNPPDGIRLTTYKDHPDLVSVYQAADDAFMDHWGYVSGDEAEGIKQWQYRNENDPAFDPSLWFLAMDGDEIAAIALCTPNAGTDQQMGYITLLGVRRRWRQKGLALGLLRQVFCEFRNRGLQWAGLTVDAENLTGANKVYEKAGMKVVRDFATYEKELRPGQELSTLTE